VLLLCFQLGVFTHNGMEIRKSTDGNAMVFMALKSLCHFLLFGWVYVVVDIVEC
jgi:hypothetical protein